MKYFLIALAVVLAGCQPRLAPVQKASAQTVAVAAKPEQEKPQGCDIKISSKLENEHQVSDILNLQTDTDPNGRCTVDFDLVVDGKSYHLTETERGWEKISSLCYYAKQRARENLLLSIGGKFESKSQIDCRYTEKS